MSVFVLDQLLRQAAERLPDHEAVRSGSDALEYAELDLRASSVAAALVDAGVCRGDRVALYLPKSVDTVTAIYGTMRAGAAYVPIDPMSPVSRAAAIARDCTVSAVVTTPDQLDTLLEGLQPHRPRVALLVGDEEPTAADVPTLSFASVARSRLAAPVADPIDTDLAYILYTSGSTGTPKGVMLTHRHALTFIEWCAHVIGSHPDDRFSNHAPFHFDLSIFDLYLAAYGGATVSIVPNEWTYFGRDLARFIWEEDITVWYSVPSALMLLTKAIGREESFPGLRSVVFAGEVYPTKHLRSLRAVMTNATLWNLYGPTETNVCTYHRVTSLPEDDGAISIGHACENTEVFAMTDDGEVAGIGDEGELHVRGSLVMKGYWGQPERSAEVIVQDPRADTVPEPVYRTGDLVRLRPDGQYDFLGRRDHQIKSRGYRIELGEIELALASHPSLDNAIAVPVPHDEWGTAIVAIVVRKEGTDPIAELDVRKWIAGRLPRHMVPVRVEVTDRLPRTSTGKVDRRAVTDAVTSKAWSWS